ncbi:hypothetical protein JCM14635_38250 [Megalodesulfovibrio paquesii]
MHAQAHADARPHGAVRAERSASSIGSQDRRHSPRFPTPQLVAQLPAAMAGAEACNEVQLPVGNLSATGIALLSPLRGLPSKGPVLITLQERGTPVLSLVPTRVVRLGRRDAGLAFDGLTMAQRRLLRLLLVRSARRINDVRIPPAVRPEVQLAGTTAAAPPAAKVA